MIINVNRKTHIGMVALVCMTITACSKGDDGWWGAGAANNLSATDHQLVIAAAGEHAGATGEIIRRRDPIKIPSATPSAKPAKKATPTGTLPSPKPTDKLRTVATTPSPAAATSRKENPTPTLSVETPPDRSVTPVPKEIPATEASPLATESPQQIKAARIGAIVSNLLQLDRVTRDESSGSHYLYMSGVLVAQYFDDQRLLIVSTDNKDGVNLMCIYDMGGGLKFNVPSSLSLSDPASECDKLVNSLEQIVASK